VADDVEDDIEKQQNHSNKTPVIVAIGASAGGIHALQNFFSALPERTGAAFVDVVHLDPSHRSEMPQIIAARTKMPVVQVGERDRLKADHVYVIPPAAACSWWITRFRRWNSTSRAASARRSTCSSGRWRNASATALR
jgi:chemotaxis response regulator CheB